MTAPLPVGITMGDAAGIGPEIIAKACAERLDDGQPLGQAIDEIVFLPGFSHGVA